MRRMEYHTAATPATPWDGAELAVHIHSSSKVSRSGDVRTYCTGPLTGAPRRQIAKSVSDRLGSP
jgi:hypothetical protein